MPISFLRRTKSEASAVPGREEESTAAHEVRTPGGPAAAHKGSPTKTQLATLQMTIDAIDVLVVIAHPEGSLWMWNRRCEETSGVPLSDVAGKPLWSVLRLPPKLREGAQDAFDSLVSGAVRNVAFQARWLRKDGRIARTNWSARLVSGEDGTPQYIVATGSEATRGTSVAKALDETEDRFGKLLAVLPDPVVVHQNDKVVFANRAALEMYGVSPDGEGFLGQPVMERVDPHYREMVSGRVHSMLGEWEDAPVVEQVHLRMDGTPFEVEVIAAPVMFNGKPAIEVVVRDVSTRNAMVSALRESEARVRAVFDHSALGMIVVDPDAHVVESNAAFQRFLGYSHEQLAQMSVWDYTHPEDLDQSKRQLEALFAGENEGYEFEKRYIAVDGRVIWARTHVAPIRDKGNRPRLLVAMIEDIGAHKELEEQLRQAAKMEALGRLASGVAHDFNNLLTVVNGYSDILAASLQGPEREDVLKIQEAGAKAKELTTQLLQFGRRTRPSLQPIDLNARIEALIPMLRRMLGEDVAIVPHLDPEIQNVMTDPSQLDQVIMNLAVNARDAMAGGGTVWLSSHYVEVLPGRENEGSWARIEIADSGVGMEPEVLERIFEPFFTTKGPDEGTGLGLAIVFGIVQQMGGQIHVESRLGVGSRFIVDLPHTDTHALGVDTGDSRPASPSRSANILVIEDEQSVRDLCKRVLEGAGYHVTTCGPEHALEAAARLGPNLDLVLTDVVMPHLDGPTIAAALRSRRQSLPILFMTGYPRNREEELTGAAARGEVLAKPFAPKDLRDAVQRLLERQAQPSEA